MNIFKYEAESIIKTIEKGKEPILNREELNAINAYAMKAAPSLTPLLRFVTILYYHNMFV